MRNLKYIIVDDEPLSHEGLEAILKPYIYLTPTGNFYDALSAQFHLISSTPDLIFLDVDMPGLNGLDMLRNLDKQIMVIITTGHRDHAVESFDLNVVDYVLKPIRPDRLNKAIQKVLVRLNSENELEKLKTQLKFQDVDRTTDYVFVTNDNDQKEKVFFDDIVFVEKGDNFLFIIIKDGRKLRMVNTIKSFQEILPGNEFIRVNRGTIVHRNSIVNRIRNMLILTDGSNIPITADYIKDIDAVIDDQTKTK